MIGLRQSLREKIEIHNAIIGGLGFQFIEECIIRQGAALHHEMINKSLGSLGGMHIPGCDAGLFVLCVR